MSARASAASNVIQLDATGRRGAKAVAAVRVDSIDYRSIVETVIARLSDNTPDARREIYVQARATVKRHLQLMRLPEPIIELEQLSLDLTIRRIEREWRARQAPPPPAVTAPEQRAAEKPRAPVRAVAGAILKPVRVVLRGLATPFGLTAVVPIAAVAIVIMLFVDNNAGYRRLANGPVGEWLSRLDRLVRAPPWRTQPDAPASQAPNAGPARTAESASPVAAARAPTPTADQPAAAKAVGSPPYRGATPIRPIRADLSALMTAPAPVAQTPPAQPLTPSPCDTIPLLSDRISCAIDLRVRADREAKPGEGLHPRWLAGYAAIDDAARAGNPLAALPPAAEPSRSTPAAPAAQALPRAANAKVAALIDSGRKWATKGDLEHAVRDFSEAMRLDPKYPYAYGERGQALFKMGETERAIADYSAAIQRDPQYGSALRSRGMAYLYRGSSDLALADLTRAITLGESDPTTLAPIELFYAHRSRASIYSTKQQYDLEIADCTAVIDAYGRDPMLVETLKQNYADAGAANVIATVYRQRAAAYVKQAKWDAAIADLTAAVPLSYDRGYAALMDRSKIHEGLGQRDEAIADLQSALAVRPGSDEARISLRRLGVAPKPAAPIRSL
jgi:tetratricopeptide (TPR) repeat protein